MVETTLSRYWWVFLVRGIAAIVFGAIAFAWPVPTLAALVILTGACRSSIGIMPRAASTRLRLPAERHGPGGPTGLQNRCGVAAPRSVGSTPAPLRKAESEGFAKALRVRLDRTWPELWPAPSRLLGRAIVAP